MFYRGLVFFGTALVALACGGAQQSVASEGVSVTHEKGESETEPEELVSEEDQGVASLSLNCHESGRGGGCNVNPRWAYKLCSDVYPDVGLYLFQKKVPFTRGYLTRKTKAVNASGGVTGGNEWLAFDEEVVLLVHRVPQEGGIQVSGSEGGYDALRLDGSCVTLDSTEVTLGRPPKAKYARIEWRHLGDDIQDALKANASIREAYVARKQECKGAYSGEVSKKCVQLDEKLVEIIASALLNGEVELPAPRRRP